MEIVCKNGPEVVPTQHNERGVDQNPNLMEKRFWLKPPLVGTACQNLKRNPCLKIFQLKMPPKIERKQKGGLVKGRFWRMYPRSGFWFRGTSACTLVPVWYRGTFRMYPRSGFLHRGTSAKTTLLSAKTTLLETTLSCEPPKRHPPFHVLRTPEKTPTFSCFDILSSSVCLFSA